MLIFSLVLFLFVFVFEVFFSPSPNSQTHSSPSARSNGKGFILHSQYCASYLTHRAPGCRQHVPDQTASAHCGPRHQPPRPPHWLDVSTATTQASGVLEEPSDSAEAPGGDLAGLYPGPAGPGQKLRAKNERLDEGGVAPFSDSAEADFEPQPFGHESFPKGQRTGDEEGEGPGAAATGGVVAGGGVSGAGEGAAGVLVPGGASVGGGSVNGAEAGDEAGATPPLPCGAPNTDPPSVGGSTPGPSNLACPGTLGTSGLYGNCAAPLTRPEGRESATVS